MERFAPATRPASRIPQRATAVPRVAAGALNPGSIAALQRLAGNRGVAAVLGSVQPGVGMQPGEVQRACCAACAAGRSCTREANDDDEPVLQRTDHAPVQRVGDGGAVQRLPAQPPYQANPPWSKKNPDQKPLDCVPLRQRDSGPVWHDLALHFPEKAEERCRCKDVRKVWDTYFAATGGSFVFREGEGCITDDLKADLGAHGKAEREADAMARGFAEVNADLLVDGKVHTFTLEQLGISEDAPGMVFNINVLAGGQLFGGASDPKNPTDDSEFGPDTRKRSGTVAMQMRPDADMNGMTSHISWRFDFAYHLTDAVDFCPGNTTEQSHDIIMSEVLTDVSRLEASGMARDVKVEAFYHRRPLGESIIVPTPGWTWPD